MEIMTNTKQVVTKEEITLAAYQLWEKAGRSSGRDLEFWLAAEKQLLAARNTKARTPEPAKPAPNLVSAPRLTTTKVPIPTPAEATTSLSKPAKKNSRF
jgi:hypothetical protein